MPFALRLVAVLFVVVSLGAIHAQSPDVARLPELPLLVQGEGVMPMTTWSLYYEHENEEHAPQSREEIANGLRAGVAPDALPSDGPFIREYMRELAEGIADFQLVGGYLVSYLDTPRFPVRFFRHEGSVGVLVSGVGLPTTYNTASTRPLGRYREIVYDTLLPSIDDLARPLLETDLAYIGVGLTYGTENFTDDRARNSPESVVAIFPSGPLQDFLTFAITDTELVARSLIFGGQSTTLRRVDLAR